MSANGIVKKFAAQPASLVLTGFYGCAAQSLAIDGQSSLSSLISTVLRSSTLAGFLSSEKIARRCARHRTPSGFATATCGVSIVLGTGRQ
jgi:hypothetical protein